MKQLFTFAIALALFCACKSDPLDQTFTKKKGLDPLFDESGKVMVDSITVGFIINAEVENEILGINSDGMTYRQLMNQGQEIAVKNKANKMRDSIFHAIDSVRVKNKLPPLP